MTVPTQNCASQIASSIGITDVTLGFSVSVTAPVVAFVTVKLAWVESVAVAPLSVNNPPLSETWMIACESVFDDDCTIDVSFNVQTSFVRLAIFPSNGSVTVSVSPRVTPMYPGVNDETATAGGIVIDGLKLIAAMSAASVVTAEVIFPSTTDSIAVTAAVTFVAVAAEANFVELLSISCRI